LLRRGRSVGSLAAMVHPSGVTDVGAFDCESAPRDGSRSRSPPAGDGRLPLATFTSPSIRSIVAALTASNRACSPSPSCKWPFCASAGRRDHYHKPLAAHTIRRLPQGRQRILDRCAVAALALTRGFALNALLTTRRRNARTACLRCQPVVRHSALRIRPFSTRPADR
jgi:hypothetical protein